MNLYLTDFVRVVYVCEYAPLCVHAVARAGHAMFSSITLYFEIQSLPLNQNVTILDRTTGLGSLLCILQHWVTGIHNHTWLFFYVGAEDSI